ncbi:hypothetical protein GOP47_0018546 [Adiantum capillus-veneris]|uniref:Uncharacterized protein n=1 Tax=Adiantum capillus-veneris TaxID=13818 RepID=A0A9D4UDZ7_ADICA|nr:hypothetical protein GOP47_0018546 [Adiantum capillus-veneris]
MDNCHVPRLRDIDNNHIALSEAAPLYCTHAVHHIMHKHRLLQKSYMRPFSWNGCLMKSAHGVLNDGNLHETSERGARSMPRSTRHKLCSFTSLSCEKTRGRNWWGLR